MAWDMAVQGNQTKVANSKKLMLQVEVTLNALEQVFLEFADFRNMDFLYSFCTSL